MFQRQHAKALIERFIKQLNKNDTVFLDCGANDGCSAIKYLASHPTARVLSFEPNPDLHEYHAFIPNTLVGCAIGESTGFVEMLIDTVDRDGSTMIPAKRVDATNMIANKDCPSITVECVGITDLLLSLAKTGVSIVLKLDVEGAEYGIIAKLLNEDMLRLVSCFYCEFHWDRIGMSENEHEEVLDSLNNSLLHPVYDWDASDCMINHLSGMPRKEMRRKLTRLLCKIYLKRLLFKLARPSAYFYSRHA